MMIDHIKQALFAAENILNWTPDTPGFLLHNVAILQGEYNAAATSWQSANYPTTHVVRVAWVFGKSAAEAAMLWLQEINLAVESLKSHERDHGKPLSELEGFQLLREALREWYEYDPSRMEVVALRWETCSLLTLESQSRDQYSAPMLKGDVARLLGIKSGQLARRIDKKEIRVTDVKYRTVRVHLDDLPRKA